MDTQFEINGYTKDYYYNGKFIGSQTLETPDRDTMGYYGRRDEVLTEDLVFSKRKRLKKGSVVKTELQYICGRRIR